MRGIVQILPVIIVMIAGIIGLVRVGFKALNFELYTRVTLLPSIARIQGRKDVYV